MNSMTSRERVLRAFGKMEGKQDRPPLQFDLCRSLTDYFGKKLGITPDYALSYYEDLTYRISANAVRTALGSDVVVVGGTVAEGFEPVHIRDNISLNEFGMEMKPTELYMEVVSCPLKDAESVGQVEDYPFPDPFAPGRFDKAGRDMKSYGKSHFIIGDVELTIFELAWHLTGMEKYMMAFALEEEWIEALNDRVEQWSFGLSRQLVESGVDAIWFGEDLGTQNSMLISPDMWRERLKPRYRRMIEKLKKINPDLMIIMHSDGAVAPLVEDFIELGIDIFNPVQPNVPGSDPKELQERYGGRICFFGGIDQQELLPGGDKTEMKEEISRRAEIMGSKGGYLMAPAHIIQADTAPETVEFMIEIIRSLS
jgi:uroporphyrinogen decarboxylase